MPFNSRHVWPLAIVLIGLLDIAGVLPDWTTIAAILTLPFAMRATDMRCSARGASR